MADRLERLVNLTATLLETRRPAHASTSSPTASNPATRRTSRSRRRQFERDKETLRELGIPIRVETVDGFGAEQAYRIHPDDYYLPELALTDDRARRAARRRHRGAPRGRRRPRRPGQARRACRARAPTARWPSST